jgi:2-polyprenyl-3-methyl-5-hydroxy-6-metoxy-1,4-benzoquinol methylase
MVDAYPDPDATRLRAARAQGYESDRPEVQALVPAGTRRVLELGCSTGALGAGLKRRGVAYVLGIDSDPEYTATASERLDSVVTADVEEYLRSPAVLDEPFDCLVAADVLEHLRDPWVALAEATCLLSPGATVVVSVPNVLHFPGLLRLVVGGSWPRDDVGVFDRTHLRWFTRTDAIALLESAGLRVDEVRGNYPGRGLVLAITRLLARTPARRFLAVQWLLVGRKPA